MSARRGAHTLHGDDVHEGQPLPRLVKGPLTLTGVVGFVMGWGSPLCPTNRIASLYLAEHLGARLHDDRMNVHDTLEGPHWEPYLARKGGMGGSYDFGAQRVCWLAHLLTDWCGDDGFLSALEVRLRRPNLVGDTTWLDGEVSAVREPEPGDDGVLVDCSLRATNQRGEETATGTATVRLPRWRLLLQRQRVERRANRSHHGQGLRDEQELVDAVRRAIARQRVEVEQLTEEQAEVAQRGDVERESREMGGSGDRLDRPVVGGNHGHIPLGQPLDRVDGQTSVAPAPQGRDHRARRPASPCEPRRCHRRRPRRRDRGRWHPAGPRRSPLRTGRSRPPEPHRATRPDRRSHPHGGARLGGGRRYGQ